MKDALKKFSKSDVDNFAVRVKNYDDENVAIEILKDKLRKFIGAGNNLPGIAYEIVVTKEPEISEKVDYRRIALKYMKLAGVENPARKMQSIEDAAAETVIEYGKPRIIVKQNPGYKA